MPLMIDLPKDADIADGIRTTIMQLNAELRTAAKAGLRVDIESISAHEIGTVGFNLYSAKIWRPV